MSHREKGAGIRSTGEKEKKKENNGCPVAKRRVGSYKTRTAGTLPKWFEFIFRLTQPQEMKHL